MIDNTEALEKLKEWQNAQIQLDAFKEKESILRDEVYAVFFPKIASVGDTKGTFYEDLPNGWKIQAIKKMTATLDESAVPAIKEKLLELKVSNVDSLFKYKPSIVAAEYKKLNIESKSIVDEAISEKPAKVAIELQPPKQTI